MLNTSIAVTSGTPILKLCNFMRHDVQRAAAEFQSASPFPHIVFDSFLDISAEHVKEVFPDPEWPHWQHCRDTYQFRKMYAEDINVMPVWLASIIYELSAPAFLIFLERLTGIKGLIPDPFLTGGGLHCSGPGGILAPHTDFHLYPRLYLNRRINAIVYLNPVWEERFGGCLEFYAKGATVPARTVVPSWGKCVIFLTDDRSVHGFSKPIAEGHWRKSIALYYYTSAEAGIFSGDRDTNWQQHGSAKGLNALRIHAYKATFFSSRLLSRVAHRLNPNFRKD